MSCEQFEAALDDAMELLDQKIAEENSAYADYLQAQYATMAAMGQVMMATMLLQDCLNNQGGGGMGMIQMMQEAFTSPENLKARASELRERVKRRKK